MKAYAPRLAVARDSAEKAFSLVELLVSIAVAAVLVSLLFSVLNYTRGHAESTKCISNLKQLGAANQLYAQDHQGRIIPLFDPNGFPPLNWPDKTWVQSVQTYTGQVADKSAVASQSQTKPVNDDGLRGTLYCPGISRKTNNGSYTGYSWNGNWGSPYFYRMSNFRSPARTVLAWDDTQLNLPNGQGNNPWGGWPSSRRADPWWYELSYRHHANCHLLMLDGHIKSVVRKQFGDARDYPELIWENIDQEY